jgi:y4mF family transcriptional regulator
MIAIIKKVSDLSPLIREKRKKDGLTQAEAASLCGVGVRFLSDLENGKETLQISKVLKVLEGLGLVVEVRERKYE